MRSTTPIAALLFALPAMVLDVTPTHGATVLNISADNRTLIDTAPADGLGDNNVLPATQQVGIGENNGSPFTNENRYWMPFALTASDRTVIANAALVLAEVQLETKNNTAGYSLDLIGLSRTSTVAVNSDFEAAGVLATNSLLTNATPIGRTSGDVTAYAKAQAAAAGNIIALRAEMDDSAAAAVPNGAPGNTFIISAQTHASAHRRPVLTVVPGYTTLLDDDFDNGVLATGGINGGFKLVTNGAGGPGSATEIVGASHASVSATGGGNDNSGLVSINSFDPGEAFSAVWVVTSATSGISANGINLTLQSNDGFFNDATGRPNFFFRINATSGDLTLHATNAAGTVVVLDTNVTPTLTTALDGFTVVGEFDEDGWAYTIVGLDTLLQNSGAWTASHNYSTLFDSTMHMGAFIQTASGAAADQTLIMDRMAAFSLVAPIPEPATGLLMLLAAGGLLRRTRSRA